MKKTGITNKGLHRIYTFLKKKGQFDPGVSPPMVFGDYDLDEEPDEYSKDYIGDEALEIAKNIWGNPWDANGDQGITKYIVSANGGSREDSIYMNANVLIPFSDLDEEEMLAVESGDSDSFFNGLGLIGDSYGGVGRRFKNYDAYGLEKTKGGIRFTLSYSSGLDI